MIRLNPSAVALVAEVVHGAPRRFSDPGRFSIAHGGKYRHPLPVPFEGLRRDPTDYEASRCNGTANAIVSGVSDMTPAQCKAARALAGINAMELATRSGIDSAVLHEFESGLSQPKAEFIDAVTLAFDAIGIGFITRDATSPAGGEGVRLKAPDNKI
jgi:hypothetical protein